MTYLFTPAIVSLPIRGSDVRSVGRVFCLGRNYPWPETYGPAPQEPVFMRNQRAMVEAAGELPFPPQTDEFCHEIELVAAIAKGGADIAPEHALEHVFGFAAGLDMTRRDHQRKAKARASPGRRPKCSRPRPHDCHRPRQRVRLAAECDAVAAGQWPGAPACPPQPADLDVGRSHQRLSRSCAPPGRPDHDRQPARVAALNRRHPSTPASTVSANCTCTSAPPCRASRQRCLIPGVTK